MGANEPGDPWEDDDARLDAVFAALADPFRRRILKRLAAGEARVTDLAAPFDITVQAVSRHIQVLVRAGLVAQAREGRVARCSLDSAPMLQAAVWLNQYTQYWQAQFNALAAWLTALEEERDGP